MSAFRHVKLDTNTDYKPYFRNTLWKRTITRTEIMLNFEVMSYQWIYIQLESSSQH